MDDSIFVLLRTKEHRGTHDTAVTTAHHPKGGETVAQVVSR